MSNRTKNLLQAILFAILCWGVVILGYQLIAEDSVLKRIFILLGGQIPSGVIQFFIFLAFFWCLFEIIYLKKQIKEEEISYMLVNSINKLPNSNNEHLVLSPEDIRDIKIELIDLQKNQEYNYLLIDLLKKVCTKFRANKSISDLLSLTSEQTKINYTRAESSQSVIRFLIWSLPSIGFIGTILGIASALGLASQINEPDGLENITNALYLAFDTTLLALGLSIIVMWLFHDLQEKEEKFHVKMEEFVIENLINRIVLR